MRMPIITDGADEHSQRATVQTVATPVRTSRQTASPLLAAMATDGCGAP